MSLRFTRKIPTSLLPAFVAGAIIVSGYGSAQEPETLVLSPDSAAAMAIENSLGLQIDAQTAAEADARLKQALALDGLTVDLSGVFVYQGPVPTLPPGFETFFISTIHTETLTATKPLWDWGQTRSQQDFARAGVDVAASSTAVTKLALAKLARESLLRLTFEERMLDVDYQTLAGLMEHQRVTQKRYREGLIAFFDIAQADSQVAGQEKFIAERSATVARHRVVLRQVLRLPQTTPVDVSVADLPERPEGDLGEAIRIAIDQRPEMANAMMGIRLQEAGLNVASTSRRPSVTVQASLQDQTAIGFGSSPLSYSVVLVFQKSILDADRKKNALREGRASLEKARLRMEQFAEVIAAEVATAYLQVDHQIERIAAAAVQERSALEELRRPRLRYDTDIGLGREVIDAQAEVSRAQTDRALAELDLHLAIVQLRAAMGMLDLQEAPVE